MIPTKQSELWKGVQAASKNSGPTYNVNSKEDMETLLKLLEVKSVANPYAFRSFLSFNPISVIN